MKNTKITVAKLIKKMAEDKGLSLYSLAKKTERFPQSLYRTLDSNNVRSDLMIDLVNATGNKMLIDYEGEIYELKTNKNK